MLVAWPSARRWSGVSLAVVWESRKPGGARVLSGVPVVGELYRLAVLWSWESEAVWVGEVSERLMCSAKSVSSPELSGASSGLRTVFLEADSLGSAPASKGNSCCCEYGAPKFALRSGVCLVVNGNVVGGLEGGSSCALATQVALELLSMHARAAGRDIFTGREYM